MGEDRRQRLSRSGSMRGSRLRDVYIGTRAEPRGERDRVRRASRRAGPRRRRYKKVCRRRRFRLHSEMDSLSLRGGREVETHHLCKHASRGRSGLDDYEGCLCFTRACCRDVTSGALSCHERILLRLCGRTFPKVDRRIFELFGRSYFLVVPSRRSMHRPPLMTVLTSVGVGERAHVRSRCYVTASCARVARMGPIRRGPSR